VRVLNILLSSILALAMGNPASAEIYESKDAQGNTVFSDKPSPGAQEIAVPQTNAADPVAETPRPAPRQNSPATQRSPDSPEMVDDTRRDDTYDDDLIYYDGDYDRGDLYEKRVIERRRGEDDVAQPKRERPEHRRGAPRRAGGGGGRR
jgi:hypothetical protein